MTTETHRDWPLRAWGLALLGLAIGLAIHFLLPPPVFKPGVITLSVPPTPERLAIATFLGVAGLGFGFIVERTRMAWSIGFALLAALVVAAVSYRNGGGVRFDGGDAWRVVCALLAIAIAAPLFQAWRDGWDSGGRRQLSYEAAHNRAWTNVVLWFAACAFILIVWLLAWLLAGLFDLIGLHWLRDMRGRQWFDFMLLGGAAGAAIGLLRDRERVLGTLQRVVTTALGVLAPVLGVGLLLFLLALPLTGLAPLWGATKSTTPILICCVIGALILANAVIGDTPEDESRTPPLRWGAMALGAAMLPLGIIAAVSVGKRIGQHGLTPDRLWAVIFTAVACAYGLAYLAALLRGRSGWAAFVRPANLVLAFGLCGLALLLSTPPVSFDALSARDQVARLESGRTPLAKFDWGALRFDFGRPGQAAVARLAKAGATPEVRTAAAAALKFEYKYQASMEKENAKASDGLDARLTILPKPVPLPPGLRKRLIDYEACGQAGRCVVLYDPGASEAIAVGQNDYGSGASVAHIMKGKNDWADDGVARMTTTLTDASKKDIADAKSAIAAGQVEVREVKRRQVFVGGKPAGAPFE